MIVPKFLKILNKGLIAGLIVGALGFFIKSIPCRIITQDSSSLGICQLPPIFQNLPMNLTNYYYGISNNPVTGFVIQFLLSTILIILFLMFFKKRAERILDLTNKQ